MENKSRHDKQFASLRSTKCTNPNFTYYCICVLFYSLFVVYLLMRISTLKQHSCVRGLLQKYRSIQSGASRLPYYCTPPVTIPDVMRVLAVRWQQTKETKKQRFSPQKCTQKKGTTLLPSPTSVGLCVMRRHRTGWRLVGIPLQSILQTV